MEIFSYLPSLGQLFSQISSDIGHAQLYWIIAFASAMLVLRLWIIPARKKLANTPNHHRIYRNLFRIHVGRCAF